MAESTYKRKSRLTTGPVHAAPRPESTRAGPSKSGPARRPAGLHFSAGPEEDELDAQIAAIAEPEHETPPAALPPDPGAPLDPRLRAELEMRFQRDFSDVRVHRGVAAETAARRLLARAFTHKNHIWLGPRQDPTDKALIAHELAHVVQQGYAQPLQRRPVALPLSRTAPAPQPVPAPTVQRFSIWDAARRAGRAVASGIRPAAGAVREAAGELLEMSRDALLAVVRRIAPGLIDLFQDGGVTSFLRRLIARGFRALFGGLVGRVRSILDLGGLGGRFRAAIGWFSAVAGQLARNDCAAILAAARRVGAFFSGLFGPVIQRIRSITRAAAGLFRSIVNAVAGAVMPFLRRIGGALWESIRGFISDIASLIRRVRSALGAAWDRVKRWLNIEAEDGAGEGGGLWNWVRDKAGRIWDGIKERLQPVMGPLRAVAAVLVLISPAGPVVAVIAAWPHLRAAFQAVSRAWRDLNLVVRAREFFHGTVLPALISGANRVGQAILNGAEWLIGLLDRVAAGVQRAAGRLGGMLAPLARVVNLALNGFRGLLRWGRGALRPAANSLRSMFRRLIEFLQVILQALGRLIAIVANPFGIPGFLLGNLWRLIPNCLKGPIIDFIISILIRVVRAMPSTPLLGLLWPVVKSGMLGFLERVRAFAIERKVAVSNKIARIISGGSVSFFLGFLRGLALGVWDAIIGPFRAIADLFELPAMIRRFLNALGVNFREIFAEARRFAASFADRAIGTLDTVLEAARDLIQNPRRILDLIRTGIEAALSAVRSLGAALAEQMMGIFESAEDQLGEMLGRLGGSLLVDAVLAFFTAGSSTALTAVRAVANVLRTVGRAMARAVRMLTRLIPRFLRFVRRIGRMFARAGSRAGGLLGRVRAFFRRIINWFRRIFRRLRRRRRGSRRDDLKWRRFLGRLRALARRFREEGVTRPRLAGEVRRVRAGFARVVRFARVSHRPKRREPVWVVSAKRRGVRYRLLPARKFEVLIDSDLRWRLGKRAIKKRLRRLRGRQVTLANLERILRPFRQRFRYKTVRVERDEAERDFNIIGAMSPEGLITEKLDPEGLHTGERDDPIPIHWYKDPHSYPASINIMTEPPSAGNPVPERRDFNIIGNQTVKNRLGEDQRVGIDGSNLIEAGDEVTLTGTPANLRGRVGSNSFKRLLASLGYNWRAPAQDADHVRDLAFGGPDRNENLWPLGRAINQRASRLGHWYSRYRIEYIHNEKREEKPIGRLHGKRFRVIGFTWPPQPNPGGRDAR